MLIALFILLHAGLNNSDAQSLTPVIANSTLNKFGQAAMITGTGPSCSEPFKNPNEFVSFFCGALEHDHQPLDQVIKTAEDRGAKILFSKMKSSMTLGGYEGFMKDFQFFWSNNAQIVNDYNRPLNPDWDQGLTLEKTSNASNCHYRSKRSNSLNPASPSVQQMNFGKFSFVGINHFYDFNPQTQVSELKAANDALDARLQALRKNAGIHGKKNYILLEGGKFKYGQAISCFDVLSSLFSGDPVKGDREESPNLLRYGFLTQTPLIPADGQSLNQFDAKNFYSGNTEQVDQLKKDFEFVDILHYYFSQLLKMQNGGKKISTEEALQASLNQAHATQYDVKSFKARYEKENGGLNQTNVFPEVPEGKGPDFITALKNATQSLHLAFTPSSDLPPQVKPLGTNRMIDEQDLLRNRSLIRAIQISSQKFGTSTAVFGMGHLEKIGSVLEKNLGSRKNIDFLDDCK